MTYFEKLKDPRWQKKRLERLDYAGFECENCGNSDEELSVHHRHYRKNADPWDYDNDELVVFCKTCHKSWHDAKDELNEIIGKISSGEQIKRIIGYAFAVSSEDIWPGDLSTKDHVTGYADAYRTTVSTITYLIKEAKDNRWPITITVPLFRQMAD